VPAEADGENGRTEESLGWEPKVGLGDLLTKIRTQLSKVSRREIKESISATKTGW
jgi:hypothetical protein